MVAAATVTIQPRTLSLAYVGKSLFSTDGASDFKMQHVLIDTSASLLTYYQVWEKAKNDLTKTSAGTGWLLPDTKASAYFGNNYGESQKLNTITLSPTDLYVTAYDILFIFTTSLKTINPVTNGGFTAIAYVNPSLSNDTIKAQGLFTW